MIELIEPTHCIFCGKELIAAAANSYVSGYILCPSLQDHKPSDIWVKREKSITEGVNIVLPSHYQFSFQRNSTLIIDKREKNHGTIHRFDPPLPVELDPIKLQHKLQTILTFR